MRRLNAASLAWLVVVGCQASERQTTDTVRAETVAASPVAPAEPAPKPTDTPRACDMDTHCDGYQRCLGGACADPGAITGKVEADTPIARFYNGETQVAEFFLEVADTYEEQKRGLMYRKTMRENWGMIFVYPFDEVHQFWMKNTYLPLDMLFIGADGVVRGVVENVEPLTLTARGIGEPSRHVLELKAGTSARLGIKAGSVMKLENAAGIPMDN